jgi:hypothetical protein
VHPYDFSRCVETVVKRGQSAKENYTVTSNVNFFFFFFTSRVGTSLLSNPPGISL